MEISNTRLRLIEVAIDMFGKEGKKNVGTRAIANAANAQMSAITYHFRSKEGLYIACAQHIATTMRERITPLLAGPDDASSVEQAKSRIIQMVEGMTAIMMQDEVAPAARFIVREQMYPTPAFTVIYNGAMCHFIDPMLVLLRTITADRLTAEEMQIQCLALLGQVLAFRFAGATLAQVTGWSATTPREVELVRQAVAANARAIVAKLGRERAR